MVLIKMIIGPKSYRSQSIKLRKISSIKLSEYILHLFFTCLSHLTFGTAFFFYITFNMSLNKFNKIGTAYFVKIIFFFTNRGFQTWLKNRIFKRNYTVLIIYVSI